MVVVEQSSWGRWQQPASSVSASTHKFASDIQAFWVFNTCRNFCLLSCAESTPAGYTVAWLEATVTILGSPQNENRCIYKGRGRLPRPSKSHLQKTKPNLQMALSGTGQSAPSQVDSSVHILGCAQLVNVSSNHAMVYWQSSIEIIRLGSTAAGKWQTVYRWASVRFPKDGQHYNGHCLLW